MKKILQKKKFIKENKTKRTQKQQTKLLFVIQMNIIFKLSAFPYFNNNKRKKNFYFIFFLFFTIPVKK